MLSRRRCAGQTRSVRVLFSFLKCTVRARELYVIVFGLLQHFWT